MENKDYLTKKNKIVLEEFLIKGFKNFKFDIKNPVFQSTLPSGYISSPTSDNLQIIGVDINTYIRNNGNRVNLYLTYYGKVESFSENENFKITEDKYYTKEVLINGDTLQVISNTESNDVQFLNNLLQ